MDYRPPDPRTPALAWLRPAGLLLLIMSVSIRASAGDLLVAETFTEAGGPALGFDQPHPRLSWRLVSAARDQRQRAYQVQVASSEERLLAEKPDLWDSGKVFSDQSVQVPYAGRALRSRDRCHWRVRVWDERDQPSEYSPPACWEMGLLAEEDWQADWIGYTAGWPGRALYFRHVFDVDKPVKNARAYVAGLGYFELSVNGTKIGDHVLDPGWTDYSRRVLYVTHDVGAGLRPGKNAIGVIVGHGWHGSPKLRLQLEIEFADGTRRTVATQGGHSLAPAEWSITAGPYVADSVYDGESYDARLEKDGWNLPVDKPSWGLGGPGEGWVTAAQVPAPGGRMVSQVMEPIKVVETRRAVAITRPKPGVYVFDTDQNLAGWAAIRVQGARGTVLTLRFAESLRSDGTVNQDNLRKARSTDVYILKGGTEEAWEPRFTYHGFRYVQVEGWPGVPTLDDLSIRVVRSSVEPAGTFTCSNELLNRIHRMVAWTEASNLHGIPTDCPQRDERLGWLNDMTVRIEPALYTFRLARFYAKWLDDIADTQGADGAITDTAPFKWGKRPADPVSASYLLAGWMSYLHYGDREALRIHYEGFRRWVDYLESRSQDGILSYSSWGDWAPPQKESVAGSEGAGAISAQTPGSLISTGYLYYQERLLARMAGVLGDGPEAAQREAKAERVARAFNERFWDENAGGYGSNNQACNAFALFLGVVGPERVSRVVDNLVRDVERNNGHLTTGNLCTKYLLEMLTEHGRADVAYRIATQTTYPSWGFMLEKSATTLWERWEYLTGGAMNSHNHAMLGSVDSWFYKYLAGIRVDEAGPAFSRFTIHPYLIDGLDSAGATYRVLQGVIRSAWHREPGRLVLIVSVPVNTTAVVRLPMETAKTITEHGVPLEQIPGIKRQPGTGAEVAFSLGSGDYEFGIAEFRQ